jgi:hypothetical protein
VDLVPVLPDAEAEMVTLTTWTSFVSTRVAVDMLSLNAVAIVTLSLDAVCHYKAIVMLSLDAVCHYNTIVVLSLDAVCH